MKVRLNAMTVLLGLLAIVLWAIVLLGIFGVVRLDAWPAFGFAALLFTGAAVFTQLHL